MISAGDGTIPGYLATPTPQLAGPGPYPGVVFIRDGSEDAWRRVLIVFGQHLA